MGIQFVISRQGAAATEAMYAKMLALGEAEPESKIYYFVPEQATLQAQKDLARLHRRGCVMNIDILPFRRLSYRLLEELGDVLPVVLDDIGKGMVLKKVLQEKDRELRMYRGKSSKSGFVQEMKSMISEFSRYMVDAEQLSRMAEQVEDEYVARKLRELSVIVGGFRETLAEKYITEEDIFTAMCPLVGQSAHLQDGRLFLDGFTGFTPSQYELLRALMLRCKDITVAVTMEPECYHRVLPEQHLFTMSARMIATLERLAEETGHTVLSPVFLEPKEGEESLTHLQKEIFRYPVKTYDGTPAITVHSLAGVWEEVAYVVGRIVSLVQKDNYRYGEIGIICGDVEGYSEELREAMNTAGIPCFIDYKSNVMDNPLVDYIRSLLRVLATDFRRDHVVHFLKNPLSDYEPDVVNYLENFLIARGIRGYSSWRRGFEGGYSTKHGCHEEQVAELGRRFAEEMAPLVEAFRAQTTVQEKVSLLYHYIRNKGLYGKMELLAEKMHTADVPWNLRREKEYHQIYQSVMDLFDRLVELLGHTTLSLQEFAGVLDAGFAEMKLGVIPPEQDCVVIGDIKRSRLAGIRQLFFMAVNEGVVPGGGGSSELLTQSERELLKERHGMELAETQKESISTEEFYLFLAFSKPTEHLTVTFRRAGEEGREYRPSYVVYRILRMFPELRITNEGDEETFYDAIAADGGLSRFLHGFSKALTADADAATMALFAWYGEHVEATKLPLGMEELAQAAHGEVWEESIGASVAEKLYSQCLRGSVSRLECYAACGYKHFLQYGLRLEERREYQANALDIGNAFHDALKRYSDKVKSSEYTFRTIPMEVASEYMDHAVEEMLAQPEREVFTSSQRNAYLSATMRHTLQNMMEIITKQQKYGKFEPELFEERFHYFSERLDLHGIIDRVDMCRSEDGTYFKIVDYKSGNKKLDYDRVRAGLDIQLPAYLGAFAKNSPIGAKPAAAFYQPVDNPIVDDCEEPEEAAFAAMRPNGILREETGIMGLMDHNIDGSQGKYTSPVIPAAFNKDGGLTAATKAVNEAQLQALLDGTERLMEREAEEILSGNIGRNPYRDGNATACDYCPYHGVCGKEHRGHMKERNIRLAESSTQNENREDTQDVGKE